MIVSREIVWEEPPTPLRNWPGAARIAWREVASELTRRPREWARVAVLDDALSAGQYVYRIKRGEIEVLAAIGEWDATVRTVKRERRLYVRYLGGDA